MHIRFAIDLGYIVRVLSGSVWGMFACILMCIGFSFFLGLAAAARPYQMILRMFIRSGILWYWEQDARISALREMLESNGVITEPLTTHACNCKRCKKRGSPMTLECDTMRRTIPFSGIRVRCASCGHPPDDGPGQTLEEMAEAFVLRVSPR